VRECCELFGSKPRPLYLPTISRYRKWKAEYYQRTHIYQPDWKGEVALVKDKGLARTHSTTYHDTRAQWTWGLVGKWGARNTRLLQMCTSSTDQEMKTSNLACWIQVKRLFLWFVWNSELSIKWHPASQNDLPAPRHTPLGDSPDAKAPHSRTSQTTSTPDYGLQPQSCAMSLIMNHNNGKSRYDRLTHIPFTLQSLF